MTRAPFYENAYLAPRTRDFVQDNLENEKVTTTEVGYIMNAPMVKIRATAYYTRFENQLNVLTFYNDEFRNFVNYALSNIDRVHMGVEFGIEAKIHKGLSANLAASVGNYTYDSRQLGTVTSDNSAEVISRNNIIYSNNFKVPTPQQAYTIGLDYRSPKFWFLNVNLNYFNDMYLNFNPLRRTQTAVNGVEDKSPLWNDIIDQTKLDDQFSLDAFAGYSWMMNRRYKNLKKRTYIVFNLGVNNILDNQDIVSGGYEQLRFDFAGKNTEKFPDKRYYAYGINFFASVGFRF